MKKRNDSETMPFQAANGKRHVVSPMVEMCVTKRQVVHLRSEIGNFANKDNIFIIIII